MKGSLPMVVTKLILPILGNRFLGKGTSALAIDIDQLIDIKWNSVKLKAGMSIFSGENRILCPCIGTELSIRLIVAVSKANAPGVEEKILAIASDLLRVSMSAGEDVISMCAKKLLKNIPGGVWQNHIIE